MPNDKDLIFELAQDNFGTRQDFDKLLSQKGGADIVFSMVEDQFESRDIFDKMINDQAASVPGKTQPDFTMGNLVGRTPSPKPQPQPRPQPKQKVQPQPQPKKPYSPSAEKSLESKLGFGSVVESIGTASQPEGELRLPTEEEFSKIEKKLPAKEEPVKEVVRKVDLRLPTEEEFSQIEKKLPTKEEQINEAVRISTPPVERFSNDITANKAKILSTEKELKKTEEELGGYKSQIDSAIAIYENESLSPQERNKALDEYNRLIKESTPITNRYNTLANDYNSFIANEKSLFSELDKAEKMRQKGLEKEYSHSLNLIESVGRDLLKTITGMTKMGSTMNSVIPNFGLITPEEEQAGKEALNNGLYQLDKFAEKLISQETPENYKKLFEGDFSLGKLAYITTNAISSTVPTVAAGLLTGPLGAATAGAGLGFEESKNIMKDAGLTDEESDWAALGLAIPIGLLEKYGADDVVKLLNGSGIRREVASELAKKIAGKSLTKDAIFLEAKKTFGEVIQSKTTKLLKEGGKESVTEMTQGELQEGVKQIVQEFTGVDKDENMSTMDYLSQQLLQRAEEGTGGFLGGSSMQGMGIAYNAAINKQEFSPSAYTKVMLLADPAKYEQFVNDLSLEVQSGVLTEAEANQAIANVKAIQETNALIPNSVQNLDLRTDAVNLIIEKNNLMQEIQGKDPDLTIAENERLGEIKKSLNEISLGKRPGTAEAKKSTEEAPATTEQQTTGTAERTVESPQNSDKNYQEAQEVNAIVSQENPGASVLLQPKGNDLSLTAVYVGAENRGKGIGTKVLESVKKQADRLGKKIVLNATNELDNATDLDRLGKFYEKNGFVKVGENQYEYNPATTEQAPSTETQTQSQQTATQANPLSDVESTAKALEGIELDPLFEKTKSTKYFRGQPTEDLPQKDIFISPNEIIGKMYAKGKGVLKNLALKASNLFDIDTTVTKEFNDKLIDAWKKANPQSAIIPKEILNGTHIGKGYSQVLKETPEFRRALEEMGFDGLLNNFSHLQLKLPRQEVIVFDKANVSEINADLISEAYHKAKADGSNPELVQAVEQLLTPQQDATQTGENQQSNQQQREGTAGSQQGQQEDRKNQEGKVPQGESQTGGGNRVAESGAQQEVDTETQTQADVAEQAQQPSRDIRKGSDDVANAIRKLKTARPGYLQSSIGSVVWDTAVEAVALAVQAGGSVAQAISDAVVGIKNSEFYKSLTNAEQDRFISDFESSVNESSTGQAPPGGGNGRRTPASEDQRNERRKRVRNIMERFARKREELGDTAGAESIRLMGTYSQISMEEANQLADALIGEVGIEEAINISMDSEFAGNVRTAILGRNLNLLAENVRQNNSPENILSLSDAINEFALYGTNLGQAVSQIRDVIESNPELFYAYTLQENSSRTNGPTMGDPTTTGTRAQLSLSARDGVENARDAALDDIMSALLDPLTEDQKMRQALGKAFELSGNDKAVLSEMLKDLRDRGLLASSENKKIAINAVYTALNGINDQLENPLSDSDLRQIAESLIDTYEEIAAEKIAAEINKIFATPSQRRGIRNQDKAIRAVLYGSLDDAAALEKFSLMFGGVSSASFTAEEKAELKRLAELYANTKKQQGANSIAAISVNKQFHTYMKKAFIRQMAPGRKFLNKFALASNLFDALRFNWILTASSTIARVASGTFEAAGAELFSSVLSDLMQGRNIGASEAMSKSFGNQKISFTNAAGQQQTVTMNRVLDNIYASIRGMPKMKAGGGQVFSEIEQMIRTNPKRAARILLRLLGVSAGRSMTAIDQLIIPITQYYTKSQVMYEMIKELYVQDGRDVNDPVVRASITNDMQSIMNGTPDQWGEALAQAQKDIMMGDLYRNSGLTSFPTKDPRGTTKAISTEAKIYSEWLQRAYEIMDSKESERLNKIATDAGWIGTMNATQEVMALNEYLNKVTNSLTYTGLPRGTAGYLTEFVANAANKFPGLAWGGALPLFVNASGNFIGWTISNTPGVNVAQLMKYYATGSRGAYRLKSVSQKELSQPSAVKVDQGKLAARVILTNALFIGTLIVNKALRGDDDDDEREKFQKSIIEGNYTGYTPVRIHPSLERKGYVGGAYYYKGKFIFSYKDGGLAPYFNAIAFIEGHDKFSTPGAMGYGKDQPAFREESPEMAQAILEYSMLVGNTVMDQSMLNEFAKTISEINAIRYTDDAGAYEKSKRAAKVILSKYTRSYIPYNRLQESIASGVRENKPDPLTISQRIATGTFLEQWAESSNKVDPFGRPIKSQFNYVSPLNIVSATVNAALGDNKAIKNDEYIDLYLNKNYWPNTYPQKSVGLMIKAEDLDGITPKEFAADLEQSPEFKSGRVGRINAKNTNVDASNIPVSEKVNFTLFLEDNEIKAVNTYKSVVAGAFVSENLSTLQDLDKEVFAEVMNEAYAIANKLSIAENLPKALEYMPYYKESIENSIKSFQSKYPNIGITWPLEYTPSYKDSIENSIGI